jgi:hypothetical protein
MALLAVSSALISFFLYCLLNFLRDGKRNRRRLVTILHLGQTREEPRIVVMPPKGKASRRA